MEQPDTFQIAIDRKPVPELTEDVIEIEVQQSIDEPARFRIRFAIDICDGDLRLVEDERLKPNDPDTEVTVIAYARGDAACLIHGVITDRQLSLTEGGPGSWLEIQGQDRRVVMNREEKTKAHEGATGQIVRGILGGYGFEPDVDGPELEFEEGTHTLNQTTSDLEFVTQLAGDHDVHFWVDSEVSTSLFGDIEITETAHFKPSPPRPRDNGIGFALPPLLAPEGSAELMINNGTGCSNILQFELKENSEAPTQSGSQKRINLDDAKPDEAEAETTAEPLGETQQPGQTRTRRVVSAGSDAEAKLKSQAALNDASWRVEARAQTTVHALGAVVRPHEVVKVTGAGKLTDGDYFVRAVTHSIDPAKHKLDLELVRNALGGG